MECPFKKFIQAHYFAGQPVHNTIGICGIYGYLTTTGEVSKYYAEISDILPQALQDLMANGGHFDSTNDSHSQWLKHFGVFEVYDYMSRRKIKMDDTPAYFKWIEDILWMNKLPDVQTVVNILMFNGEPDHTISGIISFKYKRKVGVDALRLHRELFWNCLILDAKSALYYCKNFHSSALVIRQITSGTCVLNTSEELEKAITSIASGDEYGDDGNNVGVVFQDPEYIKWKIGVPDAKVPDTREFLEEVKKSSIFKFREASMISQSIEVEEKKGNNAALGDFNETITKKRNTEERRSRMMKEYLDMFIKAEKAMPEKKDDTENFFQRLDQLEMNFGGERLAVATDQKDLFADIVGDVR
jgi:hypothetical protein